MAVAKANGTASRSRSSNVTRQRILDAAAKVFRDKGYAGARLADIAAVAGLQGAGSLYYHFPSRDALVEEVLRAGVAHTVEFVQRAVDALPAEATPGERVQTAMRAHLLCVLSIGDYTSANIRIFGQVPADIRRKHLVAQRRYGAYFRQLLEAAQGAGEIRADVDLSVSRMLAFGAMNWSVEWFDPKVSSAERVADELVGMVFRGISPAGPAAPSLNGAKSRRRPAVRG